MRFPPPFNPPLEKLFGSQLKRKQFFPGDSVWPLWKELPSLPVEAASFLKVPRETQAGLHATARGELDAPTDSKLRMRCALRLADFYLQGPNQNRDPSAQPGTSGIAIKGLLGKTAAHWLALQP